MIAVLKAGSVVAGRYRLERKLGQGGMGVVWLATQLGLGRPVAIKFILGGADDPRFRAMFAQEAQIASQLNHPSIVPVVEFGEEDGVLFLVTVFVVGTDLSRLLQQVGHLPVPVAVYVALQVLQALQHAHEHRVVHRDLKPGNVLLSEAGGVLLTDFGIAKLVDPRQTPSISSVIKGSPGYMAPEMLRGQPAGFAADLFALGGLLWECLTGRNPFHDDENERERIFYNTLNVELPPISAFVAVPPGLDAFFVRALAKDPARRHASAQDAIDELLSACLPFAREATTPGALRQLLRSSVPTQLGVSPATPGPTDTVHPSRMVGEAAPKPRARRRALPLVAAGGVALIAGAGLWAASDHGRAPAVPIAATAPPADAGRPDAPPPPARALAQLTITVEPTGATVTVEGKTIAGPPYEVKELAMGTSVKVRAESAGYEPFEGTVELDASSVRLPVRLVATRAPPPPRTRTRKEKDAGGVPSPTTPILPPSE